MNENKKQVLLNKINKDEGFIRKTNLQIIELEEGYAKGEVKVDETLLNGMGMIHGGCLFSVMDTTAGIAAMTHGDQVTTLNGQVHYLHAAKGCKCLYVEAWAVKIGRTIINYNVKVMSEKEKVVCQGSFEYFRLGPLESFEG